MFTTFRFNTVIGDYPSSEQSSNGRFHNQRAAGPGELPESTLGVWWQIMFRKPADTTPQQPLPVRWLTRAELEQAPDRSLYRLGHSTVLMKLGGHWLLTDPVFSERASPVPFAGPKRFHDVPVKLEDLPRIRAVILSHDHYDHLDYNTIRQLAAKVDIFLTPLGVGDRLTAWGIPAAKIRQLDWWQGISIDELRITATPAQHFSGRGLTDGNKTFWASWVIEDAIENNHMRIFFSGDSGYFDGFKEIGQHFGPFNLTLLETGAYNEQWSYVHMHPSETVKAHNDLRGQWLLPIHNGTFDLALHPWQEPFEKVLEAAAAHDIAVTTPMMGERIDLNSPHEAERWWRDLPDTR